VSRPRCVSGATAPCEATTATSPSFLGGGCWGAAPKEVASQGEGVPGSPPVCAGLPHAVRRCAHDGCAQRLQQHAFLVFTPLPLHSPMAELTQHSLPPTHTRPPPTNH
jgi:hypothetical protein